MMMDMAFWLKACFGVASAVLIACGIGAVRRSRRLRRRSRAIAEFRILAKPLCRKLFTVVAASGKPRGLHWKQCDYAREERFAVDRKNNALYALVAISVSFEAIVGGPMEDAEAAGDLRAATAVFVLQNSEWTTEGRVLFNLSPKQVLERFSDLLAPFDGPT